MGSGNSLLFTQLQTVLFPHCAWAIDNTVDYDLPWQPHSSQHSRGPSYNLIRTTRKYSKLSIPTSSDIGKEHPEWVNRLVFSICATFSYSISKTYWNKARVEKVTSYFCWNNKDLFSNRVHCNCTCHLLLICSAISKVTICLYRLSYIPWIEYFTLKFENQVVTHFHSQLDYYYVETSNSGFRWCKKCINETKIQIDILYEQVYSR